MAVDLPHYQHHPHLQSWWRKNLGLEAMILKTVAKVGVARRRPCLQKRNISLRRCLNPLRLLVFDSETADERALHEKSYFPFTKNIGEYWVQEQTLNWHKSLFCKAVEDNVAFPYLTTVTQLPVTRIT